MAKRGTARAWSWSESGDAEKDEANLANLPQKATERTLANVLQHACNWSSRPRNLMETPPDTFMRAFPHLAGSLAFGADDEEPVFPSLVGAVTGLMDMDVSATGLKALQGRIWRDGYEKGALKGHVFKDTVALLKWCQGELSPPPPYEPRNSHDEHDEPCV